MNNLNVCRLCLTELHDQTQSLLDPPYWTMLDTLASIEVDGDFRLPTLSCLQCVKDLEFSYTFRQNIIKSDLLLRQQINNYTQQFKIKEIDEEEPQIENSSDHLSEENSCQSTIDTKTEKCTTDNDDDEVDNQNLEVLTNQVDVKEERAPTPVDEPDESVLPKIVDKRKCSICLKDIDSNAVQQHIVMHFNKIHKCLDCNTIVGDVKAFQNHIEEKHNHVGNTESKCSQCPLKFKYKAFYYTHIKAHYELVKQISKRPQKTRPNASEKTQGKRLSQCKVCLAHVWSYNLHTHMKIHTTGPQVCELCGATARNAISLRGHMHYTHSKMRVNCDICGKLFKKTYLLALHMKKHTNNKDHICETCGKKFFTLFTLSQHIRQVHEKLRRFSCPHCDKKFYKKVALNTHLRQHTNETPFRCETCGEGFKQKVSLRTHMRSKHGIVEPANVGCTLCDRKFISDLALISHMRIHN